MAQPAGFLARLMGALPGPTAMLTAPSLLRHWLHGRAPTRYRQVAPSTIAWVHTIWLGNAPAAAAARAGAQQIQGLGFRAQCQKARVPQPDETALHNVGAGSHCLEAMPPGI
jgi:hypothetical protein